MQIVWLLIAVAAYFGYRKVQAGLALDFDFSLPYNIQVTNGQVIFSQPVTLINRSNTNLTIQSVGLNFETENGSYLGRAILPTGYYLIPGGQAATIPIEVRANISDLLRAFPDLRQQVGNLRLSVRYIGTVTAEYITIPINQVFTIDRAFFSFI